jgi:hypothetical protein
VELLAARWDDGDEPRFGQVAEMRRGSRGAESRGGGEVPGGVRLTIHHPQQHGRAGRLGDGPAGRRKIVVGRGHSAILWHEQFT